ncbi:polysaccharide deacetylase family protein [Aliibacillus thermotolerans]|nr:polysaccharide deacetylase family protein [Aliibacillus thermotolerans]
MISVLFFAPQAHSVSAQEEALTVRVASIVIDNEPIKTEYVMKDGHLLVPALFFKHMGTKVDKSDKYQSLVFRYGDIQFALPIGKKQSYKSVKGTTKWETSTLTTEVLELEGEAFVPLLDVVKNLEMDVTYDSRMKRTFVTTNSAPAPKAISTGNPNKKLVSLTFDDGPDRHYTPQILDILKEKGVKATFFVTGEQVKNHPDIMKRIVEEGHSIGNHTWSHPSLDETFTADVIQEVTSTQQMIEKTVGRASDLFRPPYGAITKSDAIVLHDIGYRVILWSVDTLDWSGKSKEEIIDIVERDISPGGIVLQHNFQSTERVLDGTVEALPTIIDHLRKKGYKFVTVQTLLDNY